MVALAALASPKQPIILDDFDGPLRWKAIPAQGVSMKLSLEPGRDGNALRIDYDFKGQGGYALAQLDLELDLPENYAFDFMIRADSPNNNFEFKISDATGENVWWRNQMDFAFPKTWTAQTIRKRQIGFAWGPQGGGELKKLHSLQFGIAAYTGGKGTVWIDSLRFRALDPPAKSWPEPAARATASTPGHGPEQAVMKDGAGWRGAVGKGATYTLDFGAMRELGGVTLRWGAGRHSQLTCIQLTTDGETWDTVAPFVPSLGGRDDIRLPDAEARGLRLLFQNDQTAEVWLDRIEVRPVEFGATPNSFWSAIASESRKGQYPRHLLGQQTYFTVVGTNGGLSEALLGEDGQLEIDKRGPSLEPFVRVGERLYTWADGASSQTLRDGWMPIPTVTRDQGPLKLEIEAIPDERAETVYARYTLHNTTSADAEAELILALRPFQVNPPWQALNLIGGVSHIEKLEWRDGAVWLPDKNVIVPPAEAGPFLGTDSHRGEIVERAHSGKWPAEGSALDDQGFASGAWRIPVSLAPGASKTFTFVVNRPEGSIGADRAKQVVRSGLPPNYGSAPWSAMLGEVKVQIPPVAKHYLEVWKSTLAYILVNRDGAGIQPGSRSYERSWIRDGALTGAALLRAGRFAEVKEFLFWFAKHLPESGYIPCVVDRRGADPVPEHDSHGQWLFAIAEYYRFTGDLETVRALYPTVRRTVAFLDRLRDERRTDAFKTPEKRVFYGLVPESISHEGYSAKPMHSYWDCFFVVKGLKDATFLAKLLQEEADAKAWDAFRAEFQADFYASARLSMEQHKVDYFPGCAELGDFDATSTSIGLYPCGEYDAMPREARDATFDRYWTFFVDRRDNGGDWNAYTPYEMRIINSLLILGRSEEAHALIDYFFGHIRPLSWNHWAEVVWQDERIPRFLGDMPHTWVGSEWVKGFRNLFVMEREGGSLTVGQGVPAAWCVPGQPISWSHLPTYGGRLELRWETRAGRVKVTVDGPPKARGVIVPPMGAAGDPVEFSGLPASATFQVSAMPQGGR